MKKCKKCGELKPLEEYSLTPAGNPRGVCKPCMVEQTAVCELNRYLKRAYGLTLEGYYELLEKQGGQCATCDAKPEDQHHGRLDVDHNHETGEVRGLLCNTCNRGIGFSGDNPDVLERQAAYLRERGTYGRS